MISVVMPVFRAERFVGNAVASALAQPEVTEIILIEDGSPDDSLRVCQRLAQAHDRVRLLRHAGGRNLGAGPSRNLGITEARCDYVAFLDADDLYLAERFARDREILASRAEIDGVYGVLSSHLLDGDGRNLEIGLSQSELTQVEPSVTPDKLFEALAPLGKRGHFHLNTLTVRKRLFERTGVFAANLELSQDSHLCLRLAAVGRLVANGGAQPVASRGVHPGNRIADRTKLMRLRPVLFGSLFEWAVAAGLPAHRRYLLWQAYYRFTFMQPVSQRGIRGEFFARCSGLDGALRLRAGWWWRRMFGRWSRRERSAK